MQTTYTNEAFQKTEVDDRFELSMLFTHSSFQDYRLNPLAQSTEEDTGIEPVELLHSHFSKVSQYHSTNLPFMFWLLELNQFMQAYGTCRIPYPPARMKWTVRESNSQLIFAKDILYHLNNSP